MQDGCFFRTHARRLDQRNVKVGSEHREKSHGDVKHNEHLNRSTEDKDGYEEDQRVFAVAGKAFSRAM